MQLSDPLLAILVGILVQTLSLAWVLGNFKGRTEQHFEALDQAVHVHEERLNDHARLFSRGAEP